ncbi:hypothetical protein R1flu_019520 [Riccia fluitans]|uniref:Uncharacterized protein n=1 Tax=Riccia fluitans TaxID=41844 RepID=A0ABD1ZIV8_9MARC
MLMVMATSILCIQLALEQDNLVPPLKPLKSKDMHMINVEAEDDLMRMWALALQVALTVIGIVDIPEARWWGKRTFYYLEMTLRQFLMAFNVGLGYLIAWEPSMAPTSEFVHLLAVNKS